MEEKAGVVIIGGGVVGCSTAYHLALAGRPARGGPDRRAAGRTGGLHQGLSGRIGGAYRLRSGDAGGAAIGLSLSKGGGP